MSGRVLRVCDTDGDWGVCGVGGTGLEGKGGVGIFSSMNCGFSKGGLNYMKKDAESDKPFTLNKHVRERLDQWICG